MITNRKALKKLALEIAEEYDLGSEKTRVSRDFLDQIDRITYEVTRAMVRDNVSKAATLTSTAWGDKVLLSGKRVSQTEGGE